MIPRRWFPSLSFRRLALDWSRAVLVGVVNVTPDSFSDGGLYRAADDAIARGRELAAAGAPILDVGGESTRPGSRPVAAAAEIERVIPVIEALAEIPGVAVSIDTTKAAVAERALAAGAELVNDIAGGRFDPAITEIAAGAGAAYVIGHLRGDDLASAHAATPPTVDEVIAELGAGISALPAALAGRVIADPGLGFGKDTAANLALTRAAGRIADALQCPVMLGPSRKRFLGELTGAPVGERDAATVGAALAGVAAGAQLIRVHDVARLAPALISFEAALASRRLEEAG